MKYMVQIRHEVQIPNDIENPNSYHEVWEDTCWGLSYNDGVPCLLSKAEANKGYLKATKEYPSQTYRIIGLALIPKAK